MRKPVIVAHRGASAYAPENTVTSVNLAWEMGADAVEVDVMISGDGRIMAIHDPTTLRTTSKNYVVRKTGSNTIRQLDASFYNFHYSPQRVPFLEEILETVPDGKRLFIELKTGSGIIKPLKSIVNQSGKSENITYIGFDLSDAALLRKNMPDNPVLWLRGVPFFSFGFSAEKVVKTALSHRLDGIDAEYPLINQELIDLAVDKGMEIYAWTVNDIETCKSLAQMDVRGITTDCPDIMINAVESMPI